MPLLTRATSISHSLEDWLGPGRVSGRLLATFDRTCTLALRKPSPDGQRLDQLVSVVSPEIGNGPIHIVVDTSVRWADVSIGSPCYIDQERLIIGPVEIDLQHASLWDPRPEWSVLRRERKRLLASIPSVLEFALKLARPGLLHLTAEMFHPTSTSAAVDLGTEARPFSTYHLAGAQAGIRLIKDGWPDGIQSITDGASQLVGLGPGLTPAGDDFLSGLMLRSWLDLDAPESVCAAVLHTVRSRTTTLSAAFLARAALGECNAAWHGFLHELRCGAGANLEQATRRILAYGSTSGADTLAGFVCIGD